MKPIGVHTEMRRNESVSERNRHVSHEVVLRVCLISRGELLATLSVIRKDGEAELLCIIDKEVV